MYDHLPTVYFQIHELPSRCWPVRVRRHRGVTLVWIQPGTLKVEAAFWMRDNLWPLERVAVRLAFDQDVDLSVPPSDRILSGELTERAIPRALRLPGDLIPVSRSA